MANTWTASLDTERPIIGEEIGSVYTIGEVLEKSVERNGSRIQIETADGEKVTAAAFAERSRQVARALIALGVEVRDGVGIIGANSLEWFLSDIGSILAGALPAGIYVTNHTDVVAHILQSAKCSVAIAASEIDLMKILAVRAQCPYLKRIVFWGDDVDLDKFPDHREILLSWAEFFAMGDSSHQAELDSRLSAAKPQDCCKLIYTSGTTGMPKAVMISHANICAAVEMTTQVLSFDATDVIVSYLPASHIAANSIDVTGPLFHDVRIVIAPADALKGSLVETLRKVRPTVFLTVPRVWEKMREKMLAIGASKGKIAQTVSAMAKRIGTAAMDAEDEGAQAPWGTRVCDYLIFDTIKKALGLDRCKLCFNSTAPMLEVTDAYFRSLHLRIFDLYGASEATGPLTLCTPENYKRGTAGKPFPGIELKLADKDETGEGELCFRGRNMFMGYLGNEEESAKSLDDEGFYHTGDLGRLDEDGFVTITGRKKELIITAGGENVAPLLAEGSILNAIPAIARAFVVGDKRKFVSAMLIPYFDEKTGELSGASAEVNPDIRTAAEAAKCPKWKALLDAGMVKANETAISHTAKVKKWALLERDFSLEKNELTPSMKVKRKIVVENFVDVIDSIYA